MRFRDALKFSVELFLPEKAVVAVERFTLERSTEPNPVPPEPAAGRPGPGKRVQDLSARGLIEELDASQFGGPSFGPQTMALMSQALEEALAMLPQPADDDCARALAARILEVAAEGERNPVRLRIAAMSALDATTAVEAPSVTPSD